MVEKLPLAMMAPAAERSLAMPLRESMGWAKPLQAPWDRPWRDELVTEDKVDILEGSFSRP